MRNIKTFLIVLLVALCSSSIVTAETNTVSSTVVTDKAPPTASAPSVVINNSDVCKSAYSAALQTGFAGIASGITVTDENCERIKLSRSLFGMGMKVAAVSTLCQDARVFDAMMMAGTPCPYKGKIGKDLNTDDVVIIDNRPARVVRVGLFKTIFFVYEVGTSPDGKPYVKSGNKMAIQNDQLKTHKIEKPLSMLDLSRWEKKND